MAASGTGGVYGLAISSVASSPNVHSVDFASFQLLGNQHSPSQLVFRLTLLVPYLNFAL